MKHYHSRPNGSVSEIRSTPRLSLRGSYFVNVVHYAVVNFIIPESPTFTWPSGQVDARSWDAALDLVQQSLLGMAVANDVNDVEDRVLTEVFKECERLRTKKYLKVVKTNRELATKYAISPRTVTNWRKKGCPFDKGQWQVLDWMFGRRYLPEPAKQKFAQPLERRLRRAARDIRAVCHIINEPVPDSIRELCEG